jgi:hypothetical protein
LRSGHGKRSPLLIEIVVGSVEPPWGAAMAQDYYIFKVQYSNSTIYSPARPMAFWGYQDMFKVITFQEVTPQTPAKVASCS